VQALADAEADKLRAQAEVEALEGRRRLAAAYDDHPALLRLEELAALKELAKNANARLYVDFPGNGESDSEQ
jgi:hypothetical protein